MTYLDVSFGDATDGYREALCAYREKPSVQATAVLRECGWILARKRAHIAEFGSAKGKDEAVEAPSR